MSQLTLKVDRVSEYREVFSRETNKRKEKLINLSSPFSQHMWNRFLNDEILSPRSAKYQFCVLFLFQFVALRY